MHKNTTKCNETLSKWCKNKHGASKIMDTLEMYQGRLEMLLPSFQFAFQPYSSISENDVDLCFKKYGQNRGQRVSLRTMSARVTACTCREHYCKTSIVRYTLLPNHYEYSIGSSRLACMVQCGDLQWRS
jgi:hypothetical protein